MSTFKRALSESDDEIAIHPKIYKQNSPESFTCSLPPSCSPTPSIHSTAELLENHRLIYHTFICTLSSTQSRTECGRVFPTEWFLNLHFIENHDPISATLQASGKKIFRCFEESCEKVFLNPKKRRLHLINSHSYSKNYCFGFINNGIGNLLSKGGSLLRKDWKNRNDTATTAIASLDPPPSEELVMEREVHVAQQEEVLEDDGMEGLINSFASTGLSMIPRSVVKANKIKNGMNS